MVFKLGLDRSVKRGTQGVLKYTTFISIVAFASYISGSKRLLYTSDYSDNTKVTRTLLGGGFKSLVAMHFNCLLADDFDRTAGDSVTLLVVLRRVSPQGTTNLAVSRVSAIQG